MRRCRRRWIAIRTSALNDPQADATRRELRAAYNRALDAIGAEGVGELKRWPQRVQEVTQEQYSYKVRDRSVTGDNYTHVADAATRSRSSRRRTSTDWGEILRFHPHREPAGQLSVHGRRVSVSARRGRSDPHVRGRGRAGADQSSLPLPRAAVTARRGCRRRSIPRRCTARIRTRGRTSTAAPATRACRSRRSTT